MKAFETRDIKCFRDMLKDVDVNLADSKTGLSIIFGKILKANNPDDSIEFIREYIEHGADINLVRNLCFIIKLLNIARKTIIFFKLLILNR